MKKEDCKGEDSVGDRTEEMKIWLFDVAHGNLTDETTLKGFLKYYVSLDMSFFDLKRDILYRTSYGAAGVQKAETAVNAALSKYLED